MNSTTKHLLLILAVCGVMFFWNLGEARLWDRDEPRNAGCAAEMLAAGNWVVPIFNAELRPQKPVLLYWLIMSAYKLFGQNEFAARFWSALLSTGTVLLTYAIGRRLFNATTAVTAAMMLATNLMFCVAARAATPDALLIFCSTLAYWIFVNVVFTPNEFVNSRHPTSTCGLGGWGRVIASPQLTRLGAPSSPPATRAFSSVLFYVTLGLAVLAKGPVGFVLPMAVTGLFALIFCTQDIVSSNVPSANSPWRDGLRKILHDGWSRFRPTRAIKIAITMQAGWGALIVLAVAVPWFWLVGAQTDGEFNRHFFLVENFGRATQTFESHGGGFWFYPVAILAGFFPWSVFVGPTIWFLWRGDPASNHRRAAVGFLVCWVGVQVGLFSLASTKLPSYVTPCYPALALLTAAAFVHFVSTLESPSPLAPVLRKLYSASLICLIIVGLTLAGVLFVSTRRHLPGQVWLSLLGIVPAAGGATAILAMRRRQLNSLIPICVSTAVLFCVGLFAWGTVSMDREQQIGPIIDAIKSRPQAQVASWNCLEPSWVYYAGRPILELSADDVPVRSSAQGKTEKKHWESWPQLSPSQFVQRFPETLIITTNEALEDLQRRLPDDFQVLKSTPYFLKNKRLVLLGR